MRLPRVSLKWKIFSGCFWLSIAILGVCFVSSNRILHRSARASFELQGAFRRYVSFQKAMSQGMMAAVDVWAASPRMRDAMGGKSAGGERESARPMLAQIEAALDESLRPDFALVVDRQGELTATQGCPIDAGDARTMRLFADLRQGLAVR